MGKAPTRAQPALEPRLNFSRALSPLLTPHLKLPPSSPGAKDPRLGLLGGIFQLCDGSASRRSSRWLPELNPALTKSCLLKAATRQHLFAFACLPLGSGYPRAASTARLIPPGSPGPPKLLPGKQRTRSALLGLLCLSSLNPQQLFGNGNRSTVRLWKGGKKSLGPGGAEPIGSACSPRIPEPPSHSLCALSSLRSPDF